MSTYKEILLNLENIPLQNSQDMIYTNGVMQPQLGQFSQKKSRGRGLTYNLQNQMIYIIVEDNILQVTSISTLLDLNALSNTSQRNRVERYQFTLPSLIIDSISIVQIDKAASSYCIIVFTDNGIIHSYIKEPQVDFKLFKGTYSSHLNVISVEYISVIQSHIYYALGSSNGKVYIMSLTSNNDHLQTSIKAQFDPNTSYLTERIKSYFTTPTEYGINSMKYIGNNLLCYLNTNFIFTVLNISTQKVIYSENLFSNKQDEQLLSSKIIYTVVDLSIQKMELYQTKIFNVLFYLEYQSNYELISLEIWMKNIPESFLNQNYYGSFEDMYNSIELGSDISVKNQRIYILQGQLVDMDIKDNKLWLIVENKNKNMNHLGDNRNEEKYNVGILALHSNSNTNGDCTNTDEEGIIQWNSENIIDYQEKALTNLKNMIDQINANNCLTEKDKNEICLSFVSNEEYFQKETLLKVFNERFNQNYHNQTDMINLLREMNNISLDQEFIMPLIREELSCNEIISTGWFNTQELLSVCLIRQKGIGFIKSVGVFERIDQEVTKSEFYLRNMLFNSTTNILMQGEDIESKIEEYTLLESKTNKKNVLYVIFALIRIYLTEINLLITNEDYLHNYFKRHPNITMTTFIEKIFEDNISIQSNNLGLLDFIHLIIRDLIINSIGVITEGINNIINEYLIIKEATEEEWSNNNPHHECNDNGMMIDNGVAADQRFIHANEQYSRIISKLALNKITSMYHVSRDLLCFSSWQKVYSQYEDLELNVSLNEGAIRLLYIETYSSYLFANHITATSVNSLNLGLNTLALSSSLPIADGSKELTFLEQIVIDNLSHNRIAVLKQKGNRYIDHIIKFLMPDLTLQENSKYALYQMIYKKKDFGLISLLNHIQNEPNSIELAFIQILCQAKLKNNIDWNQVTQSLNSFFSKLLEMNKINFQGKHPFKKFEEFYCAMNFDSYLLSNSTNSRNSLLISTGSNINYLLKGYKLLEKQLLTIFSKEEMNKFYLHSFSWLYPNHNNNNESNDINSISIIYEDFLINFIKSCIHIDIKYALSSYCTILKSGINESTMLTFAEIFSHYLINTFQSNHRNNFVDTLIANQYDLLIQICKIIEKKCELHLENNQLLPLLNSQINPSNLTGSLTASLKDKQGIQINFFNMLFLIYSQMKEYQRASKISYKYAEAIESAIITDNSPIGVIISLYQEKVTALNNGIIMLQRCKGSNQHFLYKNITTSILKPILLEELINQKKFSEVRIIILKKYEEMKEIREVINEDMISKIKKDNYLLNLIFQLKMYDIVTGMNMIDFVNETQGKILIYNFISNLLQCAQGNDDDNKGGLPYSSNKVQPDYHMLKTFISQVKEAKCDEYAYQLLEALLYFSSEYHVNELIAFIKRKNSIRLLQILLKYSKFSHLINVINDMSSQGDEIPIYIQEKILSMPDNIYSQIPNEQLPLRKCKEILLQLNNNQC